MDRYGVNRFLYDLQAPERAAAFQRDARAVLDGYPLAPATRQAIERGDIAALYQAGANPYLLYFCASTLGVAPGEVAHALHALAAPARAAVE